ncbi:GntR family transcriptional regulator (plasmid) [Rhodococcus qingshengii]|uniref:GntR family transcriptional regulator n=1 Tax=Rhodococcus TaxID=1827 RepID=UPI0006D235FE|nr:MULTISPECIES: GntR family transcriptional regulator [Rhodococcus]AZI66069.1 GntR family transcriptional regulator [Rhodococcus sp. NJ-530]MBW0292617.1 GntR family transcriptional regulator [Rhodococcus sp. MH15]MCZ4618382.1 GntR family transcriptional regulator [Rhodococcus qingshengii]MEA1798625.1 GntR family transcriptional regulator [Rhodococcus qingshengii]BDQ24098.1 GntR family transcriptional regulator [Rhodococcus qingshengii]
MSADQAGPALGSEATALLASVRTSGARLSSALYDILKNRLLEGRYPAGEKIVVEAIRQEFGVSKQPVMDALRRLSSDKLVYIVPQVGCEVVSYTQQEVEDFYTLFGGFEGTIAAVAAARRTQSQLLELDLISARVDALIASHDPVVRAHGYRVHNREFHAAIHAMAHSRIMEETSQRMWDLSDFLINTAGITNPLSSALPERQHDHHVITEAIRNGDAEAARVAMEHHIVGTVAVIRDESSDSLTG